MTKYTAAKKKEGAKKVVFNSIIRKKEYEVESSKLTINTRDKLEKWREERRKKRRRKRYWDSDTVARIFSAPCSQDSSVEHRK